MSSMMFNMKLKVAEIKSLFFNNHYLLFIQLFVYLEVFHVWSIRVEFMNII